MWDIWHCYTLIQLQLTIFCGFQCLLHTHTRTYEHNCFPFIGTAHVSWEMPKNWKIINCPFDPGCSRMSWNHPAERKQKWCGKIGIERGERKDPHLQTTDPRFATNENKPIINWNISSHSINLFKTLQMIFGRYLHVCVNEYNIYGRHRRRHKLANLLPSR